MPLQRLRLLPSQRLAEARESGNASCRVKKTAVLPASGISYQERLCDKKEDVIRLVASAVRSLGFSSFVSRRPSLAGSPLPMRPLEIEPQLMGMSGSEAA